MQPRAMRESLRSRVQRFAFNLFPAYRGTGARVTFIASDYSEVRIEVPLSRRTRNYVGTIFGGSMYGAVDPMYMLMLIKRLGNGYIVWDKAATIHFRRPGRGTLFATFRLEQADVDAVRQAADENGKTERQFMVDLVDAQGVVHAHVEKLVHVRRKASAPRPAS